MARFLGIDPGSVSPSGAVYQALNGTVGMNKGNVIAVFDVPMIDEENKRRINVLGLVDLIQSYGVTHCTIELVNAMPSIPDAFGNRRGMGATSAFKFGAAFGDLRTTVRLCGFEPRFVVPRVWKKFYGLIGSDKEQSRMLAIELFPQIAGDLQRKKDEGRAESCLIARYGASLS
jgi:crossover junction endodeoxyribonuclease RuvC